jgi:hypothetical protein
LADDLEAACGHINALWHKDEFEKSLDKSPEKAIEAFKRDYSNLFDQ